MDTPSLETFVSVADQQSFSIAATQLQLTQSAVSKRILTLETELGVRLLDRIGRQVQLTEAGQLFYPEAKSVLLQFKQIRIQLDNLSGNVSGKLAIGTSHHIGLHHLPPVLKSYTKQYPQVQLDLAFMDSESACAQVINGNLELAIITLPTEPLANLETTVLWNDQLHMVIANDHPLLEKLLFKKATRVNKIDILQNLPAILPKIGTYTRSIMDNEFQRHELTIQNKFVSNFLETIKMMVKVGLGWSVLPQTMLDSRLETIDLKNFRLQRRLGIIWQREKTLSNAARKMKQLVTEMS